MHPHTTFLLPLARRLRTDVVVTRAAQGGSRPCKVNHKLTKSDLSAHLSGGASIGLYQIMPGESVTRVAVLDFDSHKGEVPWPTMLRTARRVADDLAGTGLIASPWRSSGGSGIHLWFQWDVTQDAHSVREVLRAALERCGLQAGSDPRGVAVGKVEIFPKQTEVAPGRYGNQAWLPLSRKSVPLVESPFIDGMWQAGSAQDLDQVIAAGWPLSAAVPVLERPARPERVKAGGAGGTGGMELSVDAEKLRDLLTYISGGEGYERWLEVGMALHHETDGGEDGLVLWRGWSPDPDDPQIDTKWAGFGQGGAGSGVVTVGTLLKLAREGGWEEDISALFEPVSGALEGEDGTTESGTDGDKEPVLILDPANHTPIARKLVALKFMTAATDRGGLPKLIRMDEDWFSYEAATGRYLIHGSDEPLRAQVRFFLDKAGKRIRGKKGEADTVVPLVPSPATINGVMDALRAVSLREGLTPPCWMPGHGAGEPDGSGILPMLDGLLRLQDRVLLPATAAFFTLNALPYAWSAGAGGAAAEWLAEPGCPLWHAFLQEVWPDDDESKTALQEMFGYLLSGDTHQQKMFMIKGPPRSGKGTIGRVLRALIGEVNCIDTSLKQLSGDFGLESLIGKLVAILPDARNTGSRYVNIQAAVERLLSVSGEDKLSVERKHTTAWHGGLRARFVFLTNEIPALGDSSEAFASRFIVFQTERSWLGEEDTGLSERLLQELPGILRWALDGLESLGARGRFAPPASGAAAMEELVEANNPVRGFVKDCCQIDAGARVGKDELYYAYCNWCNASGRRPDANNSFYRAIKSAVPNIKEAKITDGEKRARFVYGLELFTSN